MYGYDDGSTAAGVIAGVFALYLAFFVFTYLIYSLPLMAMFKKMGIEGWKAWVPVYNAWVFLEAGGQKGYWSLLSIVGLGIVTTVFMVFAGLKIQEGFGKEPGWIALMVLVFPVWAGILGWGRDVYDPRRITPGFGAQPPAYAGVAPQYGAPAPSGPAYGAPVQGYAPPQAPQGFGQPAGPGYGQPGGAGYGQQPPQAGPGFGQPYGR